MAQYVIILDYKNTLEQKYVKKEYGNRRKLPLDITIYLKTLESL